MVLGIVLVMFCVMVWWLIKFYKSTRNEKKNKVENHHGQNTVLSLSKIHSGSVDHDKHNTNKNQTENCDTKSK